MRSLLAGRPSAKAIAAFVLIICTLGGNEAAADTGDILGSTVTDLSVGTNYLLTILPLSATTTDLQLSGNYTGGTTLTINGAALNFGTLDDLDTTQTLTISNSSSTAGSLTLNTASNSTSGANASDLLYVAAGGNLKLQSGAGTLTLNIVTSGNIDNAGTLNITAPVSIAALTTTTFTGTGATTISGNIGALLGSVAVNDAGGSVTLSGNNAYIGNTTITSGILNASNIVVSGGVSNLGNATSNVILGGASTTGTLSYNGSTATYTRGFTANAGGGEVDVTTAGQTLTIGSGAVTTSGAGTFTIGGAGNAAITSVIGGGTGGLTKTGTGTLNLSASNNYAGVTNVNGGVLQINAANNLGSAAATNTIGFNGGTLESTANSYSLGTTRSIALNGAGTLQVDAGANLTVNGLISGAGTLTQAGSGTLTLSGANTGFTGGFIQSAGTLALANTAALSASNAVTINAGTFDLNGTATETIASLSGTGGTLTNSSATSAILTLGGSGTTTYGGTISSPSSTATPTILGLTVALTGSGSQTLSGTDTYTGLTTISSGKLVLGSATALGNGGLTRGISTGGTTVSSGGTLDLNGQTNINEVLTLNGTGVGSNGALINGSVTAATIGSGVSSINTSGTLTGLSANTTVSIGAPSSGTTATASAVLGVTASSFTLNGGSTTYLAAPTVTISGGGGTGATATANLTGGVVSSITITNAGSGFTSAPTISFSGGTVLLQLTNPTGTGVDGHFTLDGVAVTGNGSGYVTTPTVSLSSGSVTTSANLTGVALASNASIGGTGNLTVNAAISGSATGLTKVGTDTLTLGAVEGYTGATAVSGGTLALGLANAIATSTSLGISGTGTLSLGSTNTTVNGDVTLTSGSITGTGTLTASSTGTSYSVINGNVSAVLGGTGDTLAKVTDGTASGGTVILSGTNTYTGATSINAGILEVDGSLASASAVTIGGASGSATPTLTGSGTINGAVTVSSANGGTAGTINPGGVGSTGTLTVGSITLQNGGTLSLDVSGATTDLLKVTNAATLVAGAGIKIAGTALSQGDYVLATAASGLNSASLTVVGSLPSGYKILQSSTELDLQHLADQTLTSTTTGTISIILNQSTLIGGLLSNVVPVGSSFLNVNLADGGGTGGVVSSLTSSAGTTIAGGASSTIAGTLTATTAGLNETWIVKNTDLGALSTSVSASGTLNVYNHAMPTLTIATGNNQSVFVGGTLANATLTLSDTVGTFPAPLDVNTLVNLTGTTGSGVVATGGTGTYTATALSSATAGIGQTLGVSLNAGDQQTIIGASALSTLSQTVTYNVYNHATPTLTIGTGNNQSVFVNGSLTAPTLILADTTGTAPVPLDVSNLNNLTGTTGSAVIASGSTGNYTVTGFNTTAAGIGQTLVASLKAGDEQSITGANALSTFSQTLTYNVYNHSTPTLTLITGNNQSAIVGSTLANATFTLADSGTVPAPLDVNTLSNLTGASGLAVVASGGSGAYSSTALSTATAGIGQTLAVSLKAGDEQSISGANALSTLGQTVTYNIYNHSTPTLTIGTGNNQSVFVNGSLTAPTLTLSDTTGTVPAPLDVNTLSNLTGSTGSGVIGSGSTGIYTVTGLSTATAGIGKTLVASLKSGDQQTITGATALGTLSQTLTYNVYNHSTPTLTVTTGNNVSVLVNGSVTGATLTLADAGTVPAPLDVNMLSNLTGSTGSAVIASNSTGLYTATGFNTTAAGLGQTLVVSLKAGDEQSITGANALSTLSQTLTYNVYNHATPTLTIATGNNQSAIVGGTLANATFTLADGGTLSAPLDVNTLSNLTGATGSGVVASGASATYTTTALNTATAGIGQTLAVSLKAGDEQSLGGANALGTLGQTVTYNIYNHSTPTLTIGSGNNQSVFLNGSPSAATLNLSDTTGLVPAPLDVGTLSNLTGTTGSGVIGSGSTGNYTATGFNTSTVGMGKTLAVSLKSGDQQTVTGANALSALSQSLTYNVYNHATPTLTIASGNNQSGIIGSTLAIATLTLADTGTVPAPLDVSSLSNLSGASGSGVVASGGTGTYSAAALNTSTLGAGQTLTISLNAGDQQTIPGANALSALSQTITYNIYNHSTPTLSLGAGNNQSVFVNGTITGATVTLSDTGTSPAPLDVTSLTDLSGATGSGIIGSGASGTYTVTGFNTSNAGMGETVMASLMAGDQQTDSGANPLGTLSQTITYNVYNHSTPTLTVGSGNNNSAFVNGSIVGATVVLADTTGVVPVPLDVGTLNNLTGTTGSGVIGSGSTGTYTATGYNTSVAGVGQTLAVSLKAGDQQSITGANALTTLSQSLTYNIYNHATPTFTPLAGTNQSGIVGSTLANATFTLTDGGTVPAPLDVNSLTNLTGATGLAVVTSGASGTYSSTVLNTSSAGVGQTLVVSLDAGDEQSIPGANPLSAFSQTVTYNVYNHATPTFTLATGNNQSGIVGSSLANATFTLTDAGTVPAPLDVNTLAHLTGTTGSGVVGSGGSGTYTSTALNTATAGLGQTLAVSLKAGDQQTISGANALGTLSQTVTYNIYNHATPTLTIGSGNNQSVFLNGSLVGVTLSLADTTGLDPAPLDVNTLTNLTGSTGSGVVASGSSGTYTVTGFSTTAAGIGQTLNASLATGDQQTITGASALSTLSQTVTYNVYNHSSPALTIGAGNTQSVFLNGSITGATVILADAGIVPAPLDVNTLNNLTGATGSGVIASNASGTYTVTGFSTTSVGIGETLAVRLKAGDQQTISGANALATLGQTLTYNVYNHATPTLTLTSGNNQSAFLNGTLTAPTLTLADTTGAVPAPLDVTTLANLTGATGSGVIASNASGTYTVTGLSAATAGIGQTVTASLKAGDDQAITGANALSTLSQVVTYNIYNHATPTLVLTTGNNQSGIVGSTLANATLTLFDTGTTPAPLDVNTLANLTGASGSAVVASGASGLYTSTALSTLTVGIGQTLAVSLKAGDAQSISGANALGSLSQTIIYNVYNHSAATLTIGSGNNQSVFVNGTLAAPTLTLGDTVGVIPAPLDVTTLSNLTGAAGSSAIGSNSSGTYTVTGLSTTTAGIGQTLVASLKAGDSQSIVGANPLSTRSQTITYNVYNHATPTLTIATGNNQSGFVGSSLANATFTLADAGTTPAPLDVNTLSNLTGATGLGIVGSGASGVYVSTALGTLTAGIGQTLAVSLKAGDEQSISGANALSTLGQTITYNIYNHSTPTLTIGSGNNQSVFVNGSLTAPTLTLADTTGVVPVPLDVSTLSNLTGAAGSGVIGSGASGTYTVTGFSTSTAGIGQTVTASLKAGDQQSITGANALGTLSQTVTYNVYNHATPTLTIAGGNNQSAFVNGSLASATVSLTDSGTVPAPLDVNTLGNLLGATGSGVVAPNSAGIYTASGFNTTTAGIGKTLAVSLKAGDQQTISGANALSTLGQTFTYNIYNHSVATLTLTAGDNQSAFVNGALTGATVTLADSGTAPVPLDVNTLSNLTGATGSGVVGSNSTGIYTVTGFNTSIVGIGQTLAVSLLAGDEQSITGANALASLGQTVIYNVYNHAAPTLAITSGNNQSGIVNSTLSLAVLNLANTAGATPAPLDVNSLTNLTGATGSGIIGSNSTGNYTATALNTATAGIGKTQAVSLKAGDQQSITGANALSTLAQTITYNVYNHSAAALTIGSGNNQSVFVNGSLTGATLTLSDTTGTLPAPLDVGTLSNLTGATGSGVIGTGSSGTYSATGFSTATAGLGKTLAVSLQAGDQQAITGANALSALGQTITYNVYNHSTPTLTLTSGNNLSAFLGTTLASATFTLADAGIVPAPLDVSTLSNLTGATGSGIIASGGTGTYTSVPLNTATAGIGETLTVSLNAGDEQSISGANPLSALGQTVTYNVYNHATPTLTVAGGNNQSIFVNGSLAAATLTLTDGGALSAPLDVTTLGNLIGATGSGIIGSGASATYTATGFNSTIAGIGKTLTVSLKSGDQQTIAGANPLTTLSQSLSYNVYNHATPTLVIATGNNQSGIVGSELANATFILADSGNAPVPLDVAALTNLTGAIGSGVVASGATGTYVSTPLNTSTAGLGQTLIASLSAGDQQSITGANALGTLTQTITYNIYNHSTPTLTIGAGNNQSTFVGGTIGSTTLTLTDIGTNPAPLDVNSLGNLSGATGIGVIASNSSGTYTATGFNTSNAGVGQSLTVSLNAGDEQTVIGASALGSLGQTITYNVFNHATPTLTIATGNNQSTFVGGALANATLNLTDSGNLSAPLDVNSLNNLTGTTGSAVINSGAIGTYTTTALNTSAAGVGQTFAVSLKAGDEQSISGANPLSTLGQTITYNVYNHSTPTLTVGSGNNQSAFVNGAITGASVTLTDSGTVPAPLDVTSLTNLTGAMGAGVIASNSGGTYTVTGFNTSTAGIGQTLDVSLQAGDAQAISGANPLTTLGETVAYNVYNHATPTLTITSGNNQSVFVGSTVTGAALTLADPGTVPAPLDVNSLTNLSGSTGSSVIASNGNGVYTATGFNTSTAGLAQTLVVSLKAGDEQSISGANALGTLSQTLTYNVYNHATPTLTITTGNNQSAIVGTALATPTLTLADTGANSVPLDVNTLSNLTGATGTAIIGPGTAGTYTTSALNTTTAGIGQTLAVSLKAGDEQSISGANVLSTLGQTITYNIYNHATPTLAIATGNNQSGIVGSTLANATVTLADTGTLPAPLDVNTLSNLTGAIGSGIIGSGNSATYTAAAFNTATAGLGQTMAVGLMAGDQQTVAGANPLGALTQTLIYNVYNHSAPTLTLTSGNNQTVFLNASPTAPTFTLSNTAGTLAAPLDVNTLSNLTGSIGSGIVGSGATALYTATGFQTSTPGNNQTLTVTLKAGDQQTITGANPLSTLSQTVTYNVVEHAESTLTTGTLDLGNEHVGYTGTVMSTNTLTTTNGTAQSDRVDLQGTVPDIGPLDIPDITDVTSGETEPIWGTLQPGHGVGVINVPMTYVFADDSTLPGASSNVGTALITLMGEVYSGQGTWTGNGAASASWGTLASGFGADWGAVQGSPGLDPSFNDTDSATFGNVAGMSAQTVMLNGATPSLDSITFDASSTSYTIAAGSGGFITLDGGSNASTVTDDATGGTQTISASILLVGDPIINVAAGDRMVFSGAISGAGDLVTVGPGTAVLTATNTYSGPTNINAGTLEVDGALDPSSTVTVGGASATGSPILTGTGNVGGPVTVSSAAGGAFGTINPGQVGTIGTLTVGSITFQSGSLFALDMSGANTDLLNITHAATINAGADIQITASGLTQGTYVLATAASGLNGTAFTVVGSLPTGYALVATATSLDLQHLGAAGFVSTSPGTLNMIAGATTTIGATLSNGAPSGSAILAVNLADNAGTGGTVSGLTSSAGASLASGASSNISGTLTAGPVGLGQTWSIKNTDPSATIPVVTAGGTINVYNHSAATFTTATGNNQSAIVGSTLTSPTFTLANAGTLPVLLDVNALVNLIGTTGSGVIGSNSTGTYTASALNTSTAGVGQTLSVSLKTGDQQTVIGANPLSTLSQTITYNVYNHSTPTLAILSGNNQSAIVGTALAVPMVSLNNMTGTLPAPLDVNTLTNLTGASGTGVVGSGATSTYAASALSTATAGIGQTLAVSLKAGDAQAIVGANPLSTLSQTIIYNVYNHATPTLAIIGGNNQSAIVGSPLSTATVTLADVIGTDPAPLDVNALVNLIGASGPSAVATGGTNTYTSTPLNTTTAGIGQLLPIGLTTGDAQSVAGANPLAAISQNVTYNVYNHSTPTLAIGAGNNQSVFINGPVLGATVILADAGTVPAPLDVTTPVNLTGTTGTAAVASGASGTYTAAGFNTSAVGLGQTLAVSLKAGDSQNIIGANPLGTLNQTITYNVFNHATSTLTNGTLTLGNIHVGYTVPVTSTNSLSTTNGAVNDLRVNLQGSAPTSGKVSLNNLTGIASGSSGTVLATLATGQGVGAINTPLTYTFADQSAIAGASSNVGTAAIIVNGEVYSGLGVWAGNGTTTGSWGTLATGFGANWGANQGSPGLDANFTSTDTAAFGNVNGQAAQTVKLDGANPSLNSITFNASSTSYNLAQGTSGTVTFNGGAGSAAITDNATGGTQTIAAPIAVATNTNVTVASARKLLLAGNISGAGGLTTMGPGTTILSGTDIYTGATTINSGTLTISGSTLATGALMVGNGGTLAGTGSTGNVTVAGGGAINLQDGVIGTLTTNGLSVGNNAATPSTLAFDIAAGSTNNLDRIADNGALVLNGAGGTTINIGTVSDTPVLTSGTYTLISSTGITGTTADLSLARTTLDGKSLALAISGTSLDLVVTDLTTTTTYSLGATTTSSRIMETTGSTTITSTIINSGSADTLTYTGLSATTTAGTLTGVAQNGGPLAINGGNASTTTVLSNVNAPGMVTITPVVGSATNTTFGTNAILDSATPTTIDVVANRIVTATAVAFGRVIVGQAVTSVSTLSTMGDDADFTRVTVGSAGPDANGISATGGNTEVFNGPSVTDTRNVGGTFATAGATSGNLTMTTTGEGLAGEAPLNVGLTYTADALNKRVITNGATTNFGLLHTGATVIATSSAFSTTGANDTTTSVTVAAGTGLADANGVTLNGAATTFAGATPSDTRTFGGTISSATGGTVTGSFALPVTTLENAGAGLLGEGTYSSVNVNYTAFVYTGIGVWNATGGGSWGTIAAPTNWVATGGTPGLDPDFISTDSATFGNSIGSSFALVTLDGDSPSLATLTFANTAGGSFTIAQGTSGTLKLNGGAHFATLFNSSGNNTVSAPIELDSSAAITSAANTSLNLTGNISESATPSALAMNGPGTILLTGANSYSGGTTISSGTVAAGSATAFGTGNVTMTGGTLEVGNGMHQINAASYNQTGGTLVLNLSGTTPGAANGYEFLHVTGTANLGGALVVIAAPVYIPVNGDTFTFVQAGAITGGFASETSNLRALSITPQGVGTITITQLPFVGLPGVQGDPNEYHIARYLDTLYNSGTGTPPFETLIGALDGLTDSSLPETALDGALDQLSTEKFHNFVRETVFNNASFSTQTLDGYLESRRSLAGDFLPGDSTIDSSNLTLTDPNMDPALAQVSSHLLAWSPAPLPHGLLSDSSAAIPTEFGLATPPPSPKASNLNLFVAGNVTLAQGFTQTDLAHFNSTTAGVQVGAAYRLMPHLEAGAFFNYSHADGTLDNIGSKATIDTFAPGIFLSFANKGWYANAEASYGFNSYSEDRGISFGGLSGTSRANPNGGQIIGDLDGGYDFHLNHWTFGPSAGVQYSNESVNGFTESGYAPTDLRVNDADTSSLRSRIGFHASRSFQVKKAVITPHIDAYWQHEFLDEGQDITAQLASVGQGSFTVNTPRSSRDSALIDAGLDANLNGQVSIYVDYMVQAGQNNYLGQSIQAGVKIGF